MLKTSICYPPGLYEVGEIDNNLEFVLPENVVFDITKIGVTRRNVMTTPISQNERLRFKAGSTLVLLWWLRKLNKTWKLIM